MSKLTLVLACLALAAPALAADLPSRAPPPGPIFASGSPPVFTWAGYYAGAQTRYVRGQDAWDNPGRVRADGFGVGLHAGYNWAFGQFIAGLEGDLDYGKVDGRRLSAGTAYETRLGLRSSARLRAGYAMDRVLLYATGGVAAARVEREITTANVIATGADSRIGWTAGLGAEYALTSNWSARAEYLYAGFGDQTAQWSGASARYALRHQSLSVGLSYRPGETAGPLMSRY